MRKRFACLGVLRSKGGNVHCDTCSKQDGSAISEQRAGQLENFRQHIENKRAFMEVPGAPWAAVAATRQKLTSPERHEMPTGRAAGMGKRAGRC
jgi:hypothetical protein